MNILITGGTGLIGRALCRSLELHHSLTVLTRNLHEVSPLISPYVVLIDTLESVDFNKIDVVINLAGEPIANKRWSKLQKSRIEQSRWVLTQELAVAIEAADTPPSLFISGSAIGYYGKQTVVNIDEDFTDFTDEFSHQLCQRWEQIAQGAASPATRVVVVRTGIVLSHLGGALAKMLPAFRLGLGGPVASGEQVMSWIHIDDMVRLIQFLISNQGLSGVINAVAPKPVSNQVFSQTLADVLGKPCVMRVPKLVLRMMLGEMSELITSGQHVIPLKLQQAGFSFKYQSLESALQDIIKSLTKADKKYEQRFFE
jgi:uncharacterized protein (TIGR01777 family)